MLPLLKGAKRWERPLRYRGEQPPPAYLIPIDRLTRGPNIRATPDVNPVLESVRAKGIQNPLRVTEQGLILDGNLRHDAAIVLKLKYLPCEILYDSDLQNMAAYLCTRAVQLDIGGLVSTTEKEKR